MKSYIFLITVIAVLLIAVAFVTIHGVDLTKPNVNLSLAESTNTVMGINGYASSATAISGRIFRAAAASGAMNYKISVYAWQN